MRRILTAVLIGSVTLLVGACTQRTAQKTDAGAAASVERAVGLQIPAGSSLAKIHLGMEKRQVRDALGVPSDENSYMTGKSFIPFYFGNDARRTSWYYKKLGRVVFADGNPFGGGASEVVRIDYDPNESGMAR